MGDSEPFSCVVWLGMVFSEETDLQSAMFSAEKKFLWNYESQQTTNSTAEINTNPQLQPKVATFQDFGTSS